MLNKSQRTEIIESIKKLSEQVKFSEQDFLKTMLEALLQNEHLFNSLIEHHRTTFINLYIQFSKGKEKYLRFQLAWHKHCSALLLSKELSINCIFPSSPPNDIKEISDVRQLWLCFCDAYPSTEQENCKKIMILLSSVLYDVLLQNMHMCNAQLSTFTATSSNCDSDDVYVRFGGATLSSMLHLRYKDIRRCSEKRRDTISKEIQILQAINTKEKSSMPQYLQYRDNGYMYMPNTVFVPFFRAIDNCIKEVVNEHGFHEHGDDMIKVNELI